MIPLPYLCFRQEIAAIAAWLAKKHGGAIARFDSRPAAPEHAATQES
jgi:hypothetical protein